MLLRIRNVVAGVVRDMLYPPEKLKADRLRSESTGEAVSAWWERHHAGKAKFWLSGSRPARVWALLNVQPSRMRVLDIGVGLGQAAKALRRAGCEVDALDISANALQRVASITAQRFTPDFLPSMPSQRYDLAMSFLVAQHMSHEGLREQLVHVIRALKPSGIFAIQIACPFSGPSHDDTSERQKCGAVLRSPEDFRGLVAECGGRVVWEREISRFPEHSAFWMAYHIRSQRNSR